jgi:predicted cation transporter
METFYQILGLIGAGMIVFILYRTIKGRPEQFSKENLNKSFYTMGILAIALIGFIALLILILRST